MAELAPILYLALESGCDDELAAMIDANQRDLTLPWESSALPDDWRSLLECGDAHELGDLALTKYYDAADEHGIQEHWLIVEKNLSDPLRLCLLGSVFGPNTNAFDPGRMGCYFQSREMAAESRELLRGCAEPGITDFVEFLEQVVAAKQGLYVTF